MTSYKKIIEQIMTKRDFSELPLKDVSLALAHFEKKDVVDEEKVRLTRDLLHKVFGAFLSPKLLKISDKDFPIENLKKYGFEDGDLADIQKLVNVIGNIRECIEYLSSVE